MWSRTRTITETFTSTRPTRAEFAFEQPLDWVLSKVASVRGWKEAMERAPADLNLTVGDREISRAEPSARRQLRQF